MRGSNRHLSPPLVRHCSSVTHAGLGSWAETPYRLYAGFQRICRKIQEETQEKLISSFQISQNVLSPRSLLGQFCCLHISKSQVGYPINCFDHWGIVSFPLPPQTTCVYTPVW